MSVAHPHPDLTGPRAHSDPSFKYYDLTLGGFVAVLLCSNLIGPGKTVVLTLPIAGSITFGAGNIFFPISYIFGDVLTEVYGYARARRAIWAGFAGLAFAAIMVQAVLRMPPDPAEPFNAQLQPALEVAFGNTWRIVVASLVAFWVGDFVNSFVLAQMKVRTGGRHLWMRTIGSTMAGQLVDSVVFYPLAFAGILTASTLVEIVVVNWLFKVTVEALFTPVTYQVVGALKRAEKEDFFDIGTNWNPFTLEK